MQSLSRKWNRLTSLFLFTYRPEDSEYEVQNMSPGVGELDVFPSIWGHWAGGPPGNMDDVKWLDERLAKIFKEAPKRDGGGVDGITEGVKKAEL
jgi:homoserine O-acetyltransferase